MLLFAYEEMVKFGAHSPKGNNSANAFYLCKTNVHLCKAMFPYGKENNACGNL